MCELRDRHRLPHGALIAIACFLVIGACGSSDKPGTKSARVDPGVRFAGCMRAHGVPNFPDPGPGGDVNITASSGLNPRSPAFQAAQQACQKFLPDKGRPPKMSASEQQAALRFAQCMRAHGEQDFPDPTETAPKGTTRVIALRGMVFALRPGIDPRAPPFRQAAGACGVKPSGQQAS
jgi:hypothetical protein